MALKCSRCGETAEDNRFYCASCGQELQPSDLEPDTKLAPLTVVRNMDSRAITVALMGIAVSIVGLFAYSFGVFMGIYSGADAWLGWPGLIMTSGFCMTGIGVFLNWSQNLPRGLRVATVCELAFGIISLIVCVALIMEVTDWQKTTSETGQLLYETPIYGHRSAIAPMLIPFVMGPFAVVLGLWVASRLSWAGGLVLSIVNVPLLVSVLPQRAGTRITYLMVGIQMLFLVALLMSVVRGSFLKPRTAKGSVA